MRQLHQMPRGVPDRRAGRAGRARLDAVPVVSDDRASARFPRSHAPAIGTHVYGCDICQEVCPYNQPAPTSGDDAMAAARRSGSARVLVANWRASRSDDELRTLIKGTPMTRAKVGPACAGTSADIDRPATRRRA